jgi:monoamine oxidase
MSRRVAVIGAGFSGLSASCFLAKQGFEVHLFEKHDIPGGRSTPARRILKQRRRISNRRKLWLMCAGLIRYNLGLL